MDGSRKRIQGTDHQMLLLKKLHEDDKYLHVECFSICHNSGDRFEKYFDNLKTTVRTKLIDFSHHESFSCRIECHLFD